MSLLKLLFGTKRRKTFSFSSFFKLFGYKAGGRRSYSRPRRRTVDFNANKMKKTYPLTSGGYFGRKGKGASRVIHSSNCIKESKKFFSNIARGGRKKDISSNVLQRIMADGGVVVYREKTSTPESPAINLGKMIGKVRNQKIHFVKKEKNDG